MAQKHTRKPRAAAAASGAAAASKGRKSARQVPVEELPPAVLEQTLQTVRDLRRTLEITARQIRLRTEYALALQAKIDLERAAQGQPPEKPIVPSLDPELALGMHRTMQTISVLIETHPGLERLLDGDGDRGMDGSRAIGGEDAVRELRKALRLGDPEGSP